MRARSALRRLMLSCAIAWSGAAWSIDLAQAFQMALTNDPTYAAARANYRALLQKMPQARAALLPQIYGSLTGAYVDSRATGELNQVYNNARSAWTLYLTQTLFDWTAISTYEQSKLVVASAEVQLQLAYQDLMLRLSQAYFDVLSNQDTLTALEVERKSIGEQLASAKRRFEMGGATVTDTYEAQARYDLISANIIAAENNLQTSKDILARILGQSPEQLSVLPYTVTLPAPVPNKLQEWSSQASMANLEVVRARLQTRISEQDVQIAKSGHYPTFSLVASSTSNTVGNSQVRPFFDGRTIDNTVGIQMNVPIYSGGGVSAKVTEKAELQQKSVFDMEAARRLAVQQAQQYFNGVNAGLARIKGLEAGEKSSRAALEANRTGYEVGVRINLDVLNAQQQLFLTMRDLARTRYDTLMAGMRLRANSGVLSEEDLLAINRMLKLPGTPGTSILDSLKDSDKPSRQVPNRTGTQTNSARSPMPRQP